MSLIIDRRREMPPPLPCYDSMRSRSRRLLQGIILRRAYDSESFIFKTIAPINWQSTTFFLSLIVTVCINSISGLYRFIIGWQTVRGLRPLLVQARTSRKHSVTSSVLLKYVGRHSCDSISTESKVTRPLSWQRFPCSSLRRNSCRLFREETKESRYEGFANVVYGICAAVRRTYSSGLHVYMFKTQYAMRVWNDHCRPTPVKSNCLIFLICRKIRQFAEKSDNLQQLCDVICRASLPETNLVERNDCLSTINRCRMRLKQKLTFSFVRKRTRTRIILK